MIDHMDTEEHRGELRKIINRLSDVTTPIMREGEAAMFILVQLPCGCRGFLSNTDEVPLVVSWLENEVSHPSTPLPVSELLKPAAAAKPS